MQTELGEIECRHRDESPFPVEPTFQEETVEAEAESRAAVRGIHSVAPGMTKA